MSELERMTEKRDNWKQATVDAYTKIAKLEGVIAEMDEILTRKQREVQFYKNAAVNCQVQGEVDVKQARAEERERWTNVIAQVLRCTHLERVWGGMEWSYRSVHVKKVNDICEEAIRALGGE